MAHPELTVKHIDHARAAKACADELCKYGKHVMIMLEAEFSSPDASDLGVSIVPAQDGLSAQITSPYGAARATYSLYLGANGMYGRYSFDRRYNDHHDRDTWSEVFFLDIANDSMITSEYASENSSRFNAIRPCRNQYFELALAVAAALGRNRSDA
ncbi:hypothetical protein V2K57_11860 [Pseudomonas alliivorans]|nr:hypothetical protein [Pseudomonas alliivorans]MEE4701396.1 hypothetical protein [Pseudomonas alliivorans]MEE4737070.1 hypothetical protein [Pseudomonas alliivorans]